MRIRIVCTPLACLLIGLSTVQAQVRSQDPAPGEDFGVELGAALWKPTPVFRVQSGSLVQLVGAETDLAEEFGIEPERFTELHVVLRPARKHKIRFSSIPVEYQASATLSRTITIGGRTFAVNVPTAADLTWKMWRIGYEWDLVAGDRGFFGVIAEIRHNAVRAHLENALSSVDLDTTVLVPALGMIARGYPARYLSVTAEFTGFEIPESLSNGFDGKLRDFDVYGTLDLGRHLGVRLGYRAIRAEYLGDDEAGDLRLKGTYLCGVVRF